MKWNDMYRSTAAMAVLLLLLTALGCKSSDGGDDDTTPTTSTPNHCTLSVRGDADAMLAEQTFDITYGDDASAADNNVVTANYYANFSNILCGHLGASQGPNIGFQADIGVAFSGKNLQEVAPITVSDMTDNFFQVNADYREYTGDKRTWSCKGVHARASQGFPVDGDESRGTYSFTLDSAEVYDDKVPGGGFNYTIHGSGSFTCAPASTKDGTMGLVTFDVTF